MISKAGLEGCRYQPSLAHFIRRHRLHQVRVAGQHLLYRRRPSLEPGLQGLDGRRALCRVAQDYGNTALKVNLGVGGLNPPEVAERYIRAARALTRAGEARRPERGVAQAGPHVPVIFEHASVAGGGTVLLRMFMPRSDALVLMRELQENGTLASVVIKGGTAIRKLYAGNEGRFSLDLDFAVAEVGQSRDEAALAFAAAVDGLSIGPFSYGIAERRGKWSVTFSSRFVAEHTLQTKLDFSPAPWLAPVEVGWVPMPIHERYGGPLPKIRTVRLEENVAEKIARLNRTTTARDMYDLAWLCGRGQLWNMLDKPLIRRLAVLKIWVDANGVGAGGSSWGPAHVGTSFDPERWLRPRTAKEFDVEDIGALAVPTPKPERLSEEVRVGFGFLSELDADEEAVAASNPKDRALVLRMLAELPGGRFDGIGLY